MTILSYSERIVNAARRGDGAMSMLPNEKEAPAGAPSGQCYFTGCFLDCATPAALSLSTLPRFSVTLPCFTFDTRTVE